MRQEAIRAHREMVRRVEGHLDQPERLQVQEPVKAHGKHIGRCERLAAVWFVGGINYGFHLDEYGPQRLRIEAWGDGYHTRLEVNGKPPEGEVTRILETALHPALRPRQAKDILDYGDWELIQDAVERAAGLEDNPHKRGKLRELSTALLRPATRQLCSQCDGNPADRWLANGLCPMCHFSNDLAQWLPEEFDGDESQESILERAVKDMAEVWEKAKNLRAQLEREEFSSPKKFWYLHTPEIRNIMGWTEQDPDGSFTRYHFTAAGEQAQMEEQEK